ncbi:hypothetical protein Tco_0790596 [Tanacetum coccineum]
MDTAFWLYGDSLGGGGDVGRGLCGDGGVLCLKVQIQIDILVPRQDNAQDALLIDVDSNATPTCTYVPRQCLHEAAKIDDDEDLPKKQKSSQQKLKRRYEKGDPTVGLLGEPSGKFDYYVLYPKAEPSQPLSPPHKTPPLPHKPPLTSPRPPKLSPYNLKSLSILHQDSPVFPITKDPSCSYSQEYEQDFPALTAFEHLDSRTKHNWKIKNPTTIGPTGHASTISPAEATLNWQSENAVA